jgi:uncharacterized protein YkwD
MYVNKRFLSFIFILFGCFSSYAQIGSSVIDSSSINYELISKLFLKKLNALRLQQGLNSLHEDTTLAKAAFDQAQYVEVTGVLAHFRKTKDKITPTDRVVFYNGTNDRIGENLIQIALYLPYKNKKNKSVTVNTYDEAAEALFDGWKNSPPHYQNMITPYYDMEGLGYCYDKKTNKFYAAEVFGTQPFKTPKGFKIVNDAWGITKGAETSDAFFSKDLANFLQTEGDSIFLYYSNLKYFEQYVKNKNDGIAIDIVAREQFNCNHNNNLHGSPVFDGWMLQPVFSTALIGKNRYGKKANELYSFVGVIPTELRGCDIQLNVILIKDKKSVGYSYPIRVEQANLKMLELTTYWDTINGKVDADTFTVDINHYIEFKRGITAVSNVQYDKLVKRISQYKNYIRGIEIKTYSSIEGSSEINLKLQKERAESIKTLLSKLTNKNVDWQVDSKENWDDFYKQIEETPFAYLGHLGKAWIKVRLFDEALLDSIDWALSQERTATIIFHLKGEYTNDMQSQSISRIALQDAIQKNDSLKAFIIQSKMIGLYLKGRLTLEDVVDNDVPVTSKFLPLLSNIVAARAVNLKYVYDFKFRNYVNQVFQIGKNYAPLKLSYCVCAINYLAATNDTIADNKKIESYLNDCSRSPVLSGVIWKYYLDFYVAAAYFNWTRHDYDYMDDCLEGIKKYYPKTILDDEDYIKLGKLFNMYFRMRWTIEMLYPVVKKGTTNEDLLFLFVTTAPMFPDEVPQDEYIKYLEQARRMNQKRFCQWILDDNWQLLREDYIKKLFCEKCSCSRNK